MQRNNITKEEIGKGYDKIAEKIYVSEDFYNEVLDIVPEFKGDVLEAGVGQGVVLRNIAERGGKNVKSLTGIDLSDRLLDMARQAVPQATILKADIEAMPFPDNSFDIAVMVDTFQYLLDFDKALSEIKRVLRPEGQLLVTVPNKKWILFERYIRARKNIQPVEDHFFDFEEISLLLEKHNFLIEKYKGADAFRFYGRKHKIENSIIGWLPWVKKRMKKIVLLVKIDKYIKI